MTANKTVLVGKPRGDLKGDRNIFPDGQKRKLYRVEVWGDGYGGVNRAVKPVRDPNEAELVSSQVDDGFENHALVVDIDAYDMIREEKGRVCLTFAHEKNTNLRNRKRRIKKLDKTLRKYRLGTAKCHNLSNRLQVTFCAGSVFISSSTEGHGHVYIPEIINLKGMKETLKALHSVGVVEKGYKDFSIERKHASVRKPGVKKPDMPDAKTHATIKRSINIQRNRMLCNLESSGNSWFFDEDYARGSVIALKDRAFEELGLEMDFPIDKASHYEALEQDATYQGVPCRGAALVQVRTLGKVSGRNEHFIDLLVQSFHMKRGPGDVCVFLSVVPENFLRILEKQWLTVNFEVEQISFQLLNEENEVLSTAVKLFTEMVKNTFENCVEIARKI